MAKTDHIVIHKMSNICGEFNEKQYSSFAYTVFPEVLMIPTYGSLEVTLTPLEEKFGDGEKLVIVHLMSHLFEILEPTGKEGTQSQMYGFFTKNDVVKFRIALRKEIVTKPNPFPIYTPDGFLTIKHGAIWSRAHAEEMLKSTEFKLGTSGMIGNRVDWSKSAGCWETEPSSDGRTEHVYNLEVAFYGEDYHKHKNDKSERGWQRVEEREKMKKRYREMSKWYESRQLEKGGGNASEKMLNSQTLKSQKGDPVSLKSQKVASSYFPDLYIKPSEISPKRSPPKSENRSDKSIASKSSKSQASGKSTKSGKSSKSEKSEGVSTKSGKSGKSGKSERSDAQSKTEIDDEGVEMNDKNEKKKKKGKCEIM